MKEYEGIKILSLNLYLVHFGVVRYKISLILSQVGLRKHHHEQS